MAVLSPIPMEGGVLRKDKYFEGTDYVPHAAQQIVHFDSHRHRVLSNGRRWGKTLLGGKEAEPTCFVRNRIGKPQRGWIVGPNYIDCEKEFRVVYDSLKKLGVESLSSKFLKNADNGNMHITTNWGWDIECRSAQTPESLVGEGLDFVLLVEAGRLHRRVFTEYIRPALSDLRGWSLTTGVPELATDSSLLYWAWKRGLATKPRYPWKSWRMPSWTNTVVFPGGRRDPEILEAEDDLTEDEFKRQYGGEHVDRVGRVMKEWDDQVHLKKIKYNPDWPLYAAIDYGYTNWFVWLWIQVDNFGTVYVIEEYYRKLMDTPQICEELSNHPLINKVVAFYPDPHNPDDTAVISRTLKIPARTNTGGEIKTRLRMVRQKLMPMPKNAEPEEQTAKIYVDKRCERLPWEMREGYRWPEHKSEARNDDENPMDKDNHGPEALSRFIYGYFEVTRDDKPRHSRVTKAKVGRRAA